MSWPVTWDGDGYEPLPESWVAHPDAEDRDARQGPRLLAVSAGVRSSSLLRVRYAHPQTGEVLVSSTNATEGDGGFVPTGLDGQGWPRSLRPGRSEPVGRLRGCEWEHIQALWSDRLAGVSVRPQEVTA